MERHQPGRPADDELGSIWVKATIDESDHYHLTVEYDADTAITFERDGAVAYATELYTAVARAAHDAAVMSQLTLKLDITAPDAAKILWQLRSSRPPLNEDALGLLRVEPGVSLFNGAPFLKCWLTKGKLAWQWDPREAEQHAQQVLQCYPVTILDGEYRRLLVDWLGLEPPMAVQAVDDLINFRHG